MSKKLHVRFDRKPAVTITRRAVRADKLVYIACTNKPNKYRYDRSRIAYIGTTKAGAKRIAASAAAKAEELLQLHGVKSLDFHTVVCTPVPGVTSWRFLERALILRFREKLGDPPKGNIHGTKMKPDGSENYFSQRALDKIIKAYS